MKKPEPIQFTLALIQLELATRNMDRLMSEIEAISTHPKFRKSDRKELHQIACHCAAHGAALYRIGVLSS